jgi:E3 ubiquitin-protein ligase listerin
MSDSDVLPTIARTLKLVILIEDLSSSNKSLRADWDPRREGVFSLVRDMASVQLGWCSLRSFAVCYTDQGSI